MECFYNSESLCYYGTHNIECQVWLYLQVAKQNRNGDKLALLQGRRSALAYETLHGTVLHLSEGCQVGSIPMLAHMMEPTSDGGDARKRGLGTSQVCQFLKDKERRERLEPTSKGMGPSEVKAQTKGKIQNKGVVFPPHCFVEEFFLSPFEGNL